MEPMLAARRLVPVHAGALALAAGVFAVRWVSAPGRPVPAGLVVLGAALVVVAVVRRPPACLVGVAAALLVAVHLEPRLTAGTVVLGFALVVALLTGLTAGVLHAVSRRRSAAPRPSYGAYVQPLFLLLLSPVCAEYLSAYDDSTGHPWQLVANLWIFVPLYGCAALLVREVARRARIGWWGILLLGVAFGVVQAGVVDQSLFSPDYRGIHGWEETYRATLIGPLGISAANALGFVSGHAIASISAPIALVEAVRPARATRPWIGRRALVLTGLVYAAGSAFVLRYHLRTETWHASPGELLGAGAVAAACVAAAFVLGRRSRETRETHRDRPGRTVRLPVLLSGALLLALVHASVPQTWTGVGVDVAVLAVAAAATAVLSRRPGWTPTHAALVAAAPLLGTVVLAFTYPPLVGEVSPAAKYAHNAVMAAIVVGATVLAVRRRTACTPAASAGGAARVRGRPGGAELGSDGGDVGPGEAR